MKGEVVFWAGMFILVILFVDGSSGTDLHSAIVTWLTEN